MKAVEAQFDKRRPLLLEQDRIEVRAGSRYSYTDAFTAYESFMLKGKLTYSGKGSFGLAFDYNGQDDKTKIICLNPSKQTLQLLLNEGDTMITETAVRLYGVSGKPIRLFAENNTITFSDLREYTR